ncbi:MAG: addiction module toxin, HicA family [Gammaproteobacteria bacterium]|nr:addiction module toxin, HicA family [Gammaproteobacteria bacterium]MYF02581.1 addiction module toxin, HicA family [Gammaproteobacteria bacterium]
MSDYSREVKKRIKAVGWKLIRQPRDSHEIWGKDGKEVPVPYKIKSRHTANAILKTAGLSKI